MEAFDFGGDYSYFFFHMSTTVEKAVIIVSEINDFWGGKSQKPGK